jgi:hypothetical protein
MKIDAFSVNLSSSRHYSQTQTSEVNHEFSFMDLMDRRMGNAFDPRDRASVIKAAAVPGANGASPWYQPVIVDGQPGVSLTDQFLVEMEKMRRVMSTIMAHFQEMMSQGCTCELNQIQQLYAMPVSLNNSSQFRYWEYTESRRFTYEETENLRVSADGVVRTADNREIDFSFAMDVGRQFIHESYFEYTESGVALIDPMIIGVDVDAPLLSGGQFAFDLNQDGEDETLTMPGAGYGFLALDLNGDGEINDGSELFGPTTGDAFAELAEYDLDQNLWIDENDEIFDKLTLWEEDGEGGMTLTRIKDAGIGAIYLAGITSEFDYKTDENDLVGRMGKTSIALSEEGEVMPVHEVDYNV